MEQKQPFSGTYTGSRFPDVQIIPQEERNHGGLIEYTTLPQAFAEYRSDPHGSKRMQFLQDAYGIQDPEAFLREAGLEGYLAAKREGAMVSAVKSHALVTTPYNFTDVIVNGQLARMHGIKGACLVMGYEDDVFHSSPEKMYTLQQQHFYVGKDPKGNDLYTSVDVVPVGIKLGEGNIRPVSSIADIEGVPMKDIIVELKRPKTAKQAPAYERNGEDETAYIEAAIGMLWGDVLQSNTEFDPEYPDKITLTQLHRTLFDKTIQRLRDEGVIPGEEQFSIIYAELKTVTSALRKHAQIGERTAEIMGTSLPAKNQLAELFCVQPDTIKMVISKMKGEEVDDTTLRRAIANHHYKLSEDQVEFIRDLDVTVASQVLNFIMESQGVFVDECSGLLCKKTADGIAVDPLSYYPPFSILLDYDHTSLDEPSYFFTDKIVRCQQLQRAYGAPISVIRTPYEEIPALINDRIHPTGIYYDVREAMASLYSSVLAPLQKQMQMQTLVDMSLPQSTKKQSKAVRDAQAHLLATVKEAHLHETLQGIRSHVGHRKHEFHEQQRKTDELVTHEVLGWWLQMLLSTVEAD